MAERERFRPKVNGVIVSASGCSPCVCGGGHGHDTDVPKILIRHGDPIKF